MNPILIMDPFSGKPWQIRLIEQEQIRYPMRFRTTEAGIHFWNTGDDLGQYVPPFLQEGDKTRINPAWLDKDQAPFEFKTIPNTKP